jgi:hypothetical protein
MNMRLNFKTLLLVSSLCLGLLPVIADSAPGLPDEVIGANAMNYMDTLPLMRDLVICREMSTHDKTGGNDNGFSNKAEFVRREGIGRIALMDAAGPGCLYSFWYSWPNHPGYMTRVEPVWKLMLGKVKYFFDNEKSPRISIPLRDLVGTHPHTWPIAVHADDSTGGYITYAPIPFQHGLKVTIGGPMPNFFNHQWYHLYPMGTRVNTWTGAENLSKFSKMWNPSIAEKPAGDKYMAPTRTLVLSRGATEIARLKGCGEVRAIRIELPEDDAALRDLWLRAFFDGEEDPSIHAPLSLFFAVESRFTRKEVSKKQNVELKSLVVGRDEQGLYYFRLPMPYKKSAVIKIENRGSDAVTIDRARTEYVESCRPGLGRTTGYLRTQFRETDSLTPGRDYVLAELGGRGHIVGTVLAVEDTPVSFLEGDERVYTDGGRSPFIMGDATETYFNGSWYFLGEAFACPTHGAPTFHYHDKGTDITMYRFHLTDLVPYRNGARFSIQHGGLNEVQGKYRSLVFYYGLSEPSLIKSDYINMADENDLSEHDYSGAPAERVRERDGFFEGDFNGQDLGVLERPSWMNPGSWMLWNTVRSPFHKPPKDSPDRVSFKVAYHDEPYEFVVKIDPDADAIMLRRLLDQSVRDQKAVIEVDGRPAGVWFNTLNNRWKIFCEDDLILDPETTRGKSEIRIRVSPQLNVLTAAEYTVFSIVVP